MSQGTALALLYAGFHKEVVFWMDYFESSNIGMQHLATLFMSQCTVSASMKDGFYKERVFWREYFGSSDVGKKNMSCSCQVVQGDI